MSEAKDISGRAVSPLEVTIEPKQGFKVMRGMPTQLDTQGLWNPTDTEMIVIPDTPHVFTVDELTVRDREHQRGTLKGY